jgi:hypothetical protein
MPQSSKYMFHSKTEYTRTSGCESRI